MRVNLAVGELTLGGATRVAGLAGALTLGASGAAGAVTALLAGLMGVYLAVGELSLLHALVGSAVLLEAIVLAGLVGVRHGDCFEF